MALCAMPEDESAKSLRWLEVRLTLSGNASQFLLVEEARKGEDRQVWIASWKRTASAGARPAPF